MRAGRLVQRLPLHWCRFLERAWVRVRQRRAEDTPIVFLIALPRSGSTLAYQALIHGLEPLYLSNLWNLLYALPWTGGALSRLRCRGHESDFRSRQGFVSGLCGPAEGLRFWSYWTGMGLVERAGEPVADTRLACRVGYLRSVLSTLTASDRPMLAGYLGHALGPERLRAWFPDAVFVRLRRDPLSNALSILRCRQADSGAWFSTFPRECENVVGRGIHAEVAAQVYWLNRRLEALQADGRTVQVTYENICDHPAHMVETVAEHCNHHGMTVSLRKRLPASFEYRAAGQSDDDDTRKLAVEFARLERAHGPLRESQGAKAGDR